jgi:hypothetical protein
MRLEGGQWLLSARASRLFFVSSVVVLATGFLIVGIAKLSLQHHAIQETLERPTFYLPIGAVLALNALCALFILAGMLWYWVRFDDSRRILKLLWLASVLFLAWYSMSIYYFVVYRPQRRLATRGATQ